MTLTFHRTDERLLIKYIDDTFNIFSCVIPYHDKFVIDYCNSKLEKLEKLLNNYILEEHDNKIILKVEEPICINYVLNKQTNTAGEQSGLILAKLKQLEKENKILKEKLEDNKLFYIDGYTFPINKDIQQLDINLSLCPNIKPCFTINLSQLSICKNLTKFGIDLPNISTLDFSPFQNLLELTIINNDGNLKSILGFENLKKLNYLRYENSIDVDIQKSFFENCTSLDELYITGKIFKSSIFLDLTILRKTITRLTIHNWECNHITGLSNISGLEKCELLKYINFNNIRLNLQDINPFNNLKLLEELILINISNISQFSKITQCINLKKIKCDMIPDNNTDMSCLQFIESIELVREKKEIYIPPPLDGSKFFKNLRGNVKKIGFNI